MGKVFNKPIELYTAQMQRFQAVKLTARQMHSEIAEAAKEDLLTATGGDISKQTLRKLGHPYGRGTDASASTPKGAMRSADKDRRKALGIKGSVPLLPINKQSGGLRRGIFLICTSRNPQAFSLGSSASYAKYILHPAGTKKMVGRRVFSGKDLGYTASPGVINQRWAARNKAMLDTLKRRQSA